MYIFYIFMLFMIVSCFYNMWTNKRIKEDINDLKKDIKLLKEDIYNQKILDKEL